MSAVAKSSICGGLIAGTVDIGAAALISLASPLRILLAIASGLLGKAAFSAGDPVMLLGLALQLGMSVLIAAIYSMAAARFPELARRWVLGGALYGVIVFVVMNFLVVPLSAAPFRLPIKAAAVSANLLAMLVFGWIVAFTAHRFLEGGASARVAAAAAPIPNARDRAIERRAPAPTTHPTDSATGTPRATSTRTRYTR